jgi:LAO/AO transport system kinase
MEMADTIVINKADGDNIRKAQLAKSEFNRALHLFPAKKVRLDSYNCNLQCNYTRRIPVWKPSRNLSNSRKAMIILMKNAWNRTNIDARGYN